MLGFPRLLDMLFKKLTSTIIVASYGPTWRLSRSAGVPSRCQGATWVVSQQANETVLWSNSSFDQTVSSMNIKWHFLSWHCVHFPSSSLQFKRRTDRHIECTFGIDTSLLRFQVSPSHSFRVISRRQLCRVLSSQRLSTTSCHLLHVKSKNMHQI